MPFDPQPASYWRFANGYFAPAEYSDWTDESQSWKTTAYVGDWTPLLKLVLEGAGVIDFFSGYTVNSLEKFAIGQAKHVVMCNARGRIMAEGILMRLAETRFLLTGSPVVRWTEYLVESLKPRDVRAFALGSSHFITQVQGPASLAIMEKAMGESLRDLPFMRFRSGRVAGRDILILRQGMAGEVGFELHGASDDGPAVYGAILEAGKEFGIRRLGERTKMVNHVEACFPTFSVDFVPDWFGEEEKPYLEWLAVNYPGSTGVGTTGSFDSSDIRTLCRTPYELGWGKNIKFDHSFLGRAALEAARDQEHRSIVTLVWNADDVVDVYASLFRDGQSFEYMEMPRNGIGIIRADAVMDGEDVVGVSTSRCYSYSFKKMLSLCVIDPAYKLPGTEVSVIWGVKGGPQKRIRCEVAPAPFKTDNRRLNLTDVTARAPNVR